MNCTNFEPQNGAVILGWNVDFDRHDTIEQFKTRMASVPPTGFQTTPGAYGIFIKIGASGLIGQTPGDARKEDLDTMLEQMKGTNAILVTSLDPTEGYAAVTDAGLDQFATKIAEFNNYGIPVLIRPAHEMNGPWYAYGRQPGAFKRFYRRVYDAVKKKAKYARFIFAPNLGNGYPWAAIPPKTPLTATDLAEADTNGDGIVDTRDDPYTPYWPGADVVDWFGVSMYFKGTYPYAVNEVAPPTYLGDQMTIVLGGGVSTYDFARQYNLPIVFPEFAGSYAAEHTGTTNLLTKRAVWEEAFGLASRTKFPLLKLALWFDYSKPEDAAQRDFSISNQNATIPSGGSINEVAPTFKRDIATYTSLIYGPNLELSGSGNCGCFRNNAAGTATPQQSNSVQEPVSSPTKSNVPLTANASESSKKLSYSGLYLGIVFILFFFF